MVKRKQFVEDEEPFLRVSEEEFFANSSKYWNMGYEKHPEILKNIQNMFF